MKRILIVLSLLLSLPSVGAFAADDVTSDIADRIQSRYESVKAFEADFRQIQTRAVINIATESTGHIWYQNPSLVRWETREPEESREVIVVGPEYVWDYIEEMNTANKMPLPQMLNSKTLLRFISGRANLKDDFRIEGVWDGDEKLKRYWEGSGLLLFRLVPHQPEAGMMLAYIGVEPDTFVLRRVMTVDYQGNANEIHLENLAMDTKMPSGIFEFEPPKGTIIEDSTLPEGEKGQ